MPCTQAAHPHKLIFTFPHTILPFLMKYKHLVLGRAYRQHGHRNAVELVEAPPGARLGKPLVDLAHGSEIQLVRAVEHVALHSERTCEILGGLCLARTCFEVTELCEKAVGKSYSEQRSSVSVVLVRFKSICKGSNRSGAMRSISKLHGHPTAMKTQLPNKQRPLLSHTRALRYQILMTNPAGQPQSTCHCRQALSLVNNEGLRHD